MIEKPDHPRFRPALGKTRSDLIEEINSHKRVDVAVIGGGIHGAAVARLCAFQGFSTVLLERDDYAGATSGRSSRMLHGGLRYLEQFDFRQVLEGVRAREDIFKAAPHLALPMQFLFPVKHGDWWTKLKLKIGLSIYDAAVPASRRHQWWGRDQINRSGLAQLSSEYAGGYLYADGIMDDRRLVFENILSARQEGALCLNYAEVEAVTNFQSEQQVLWRDKALGDQYQLKAGIIVNCAGPWAPFIGRLSRSSAKRQVVYSRGSHLLFSVPWHGPALILPLPERGRYYFVWPANSMGNNLGHPATMVGTTEREVADPERSPVPSEDEIEELLANLARDLPGSGLERANIYGSYAGVRTLPLRDSQAGSAAHAAEKPGALSRRHIWNYSNGMLTLLGGKYTTAYWTALEGVKEVARLAGVTAPIVALTDRVLPGAVMLEDERQAFFTQSAEHGVSLETSEFILAKFGSLVRHFPKEADDWVELGRGVTKGLVRYCVRQEQATCLDDIWARRLGLDRAAPALLEPDLKAKLSQVLALELNS